MPYFSVRCKNPEKDCQTYITTKYFTGCTEPADIAKQMKQCEPVTLKCGVCGYTATYIWSDLGVAGDMK